MNRRQLIAEELLKEMYKPQFPVTWQVAGYGLGIFSKLSHGGTLLWHGGGGYGYNTMQQWIPEYQVGIVVLTNDGDGSPLCEETANIGLEKMIEAKYGRIQPDRSVKLTNKPVIELDEKELSRLEGTYKAYSGLLTLNVEDRRLNIKRGNGSNRLNAHSSTEFTFNLNTPNTEKLTFYLDSAGKPIFVHDLGSNGTDFFIPNDSPTDEPGPNHSEWSEYIGEYKAIVYGNEVFAKILIKNGYLYTSRGVKLTEYKQGLFFTSDGEAVAFHEGRMHFGNRPYIKSK